jgi:hypothetical protein
MLQYTYIASICDTYVILSASHAQFRAQFQSTASKGVQLELFEVISQEDEPENQKKHNADIAKSTL